MPSSAAPPAHLPGSLTKMSEVTRIEPTLRQVQDLIIRLKVQAFVVIIHDLFARLPELMELNIASSDDDSQLLFNSFENDDMLDGDFNEATEIVGRLDMPLVCFSAFETQQPFMRDSLAESLADAYDTALSTDQKQRGGSWNHFWGNLVPLDSF